MARSGTLPHTLDLPKKDSDSLDSSALTPFTIEIITRKKIWAKSLEDAYLEAAIWAIDESAIGFGASHSMEDS